MNQFYIPPSSFISELNKSFHKFILWTLRKKTPTKKGCWWLDSNLKKTELSSHFCMGPFTQITLRREAYAEILASTLKHGCSVTLPPEPAFIKELWYPVSGHRTDAFPIQLELCSSEQPEHLHSHQSGQFFRTKQTDTWEFRILFAWRKD